MPAIAQWAKRRRVVLSHKSQFVIMLLTDWGQQIHSQRVKVSDKVVTAQCRAQPEAPIRVGFCIPIAIFLIHATFFFDRRQIGMGRIAQRNWYCGI